MRYFVTFKKNTNLYGKLMPFTKLLKQEIQDRLIQEYGQMWDKIYTEPEAKRVLQETLLQENNWIQFGTKCIEEAEDHKVSVSDITLWFKTAKPTPTERNLSTQLGAHIEEFCEMLEALGELVPQQLLAIKEKYYQGAEIKQDKVALLDSLCDQVVTATGIAYFNGFDFDGALTNVNQSNWSKFINNKPICNEHGKIMKGANYKAPELEPFI